MEASPEIKIRLPSDTLRTYATQSRATSLRNPVLPLTERVCDPHARPLCPIALGVGQLSESLS